MALIKCYECGKDISDKAMVCPNCGAPKLEPELEPIPKYEFDAAAQRFMEVRQEPVHEYKANVLREVDGTERSATAETVLIIIGNILCAAFKCFWIGIKVCLYIAIVLPFKILTFFLIFFSVSSAVSSRKQRGFW